MVAIAHPDTPNVKCTPAGTTTTIINNRNNTGRPNTHRQGAATGVVVEDHTTVGIQVLEAVATTLATAEADTTNGMGHKTLHTRVKTRDNHKTLITYPINNIATQVPAAVVETTGEEVVDKALVVATNSSNNRRRLLPQPTSFCTQPGILTSL
jgi:hypothetical protein